MSRIGETIRRNAGREDSIEAGRLKRFKGKGAGSTPLTLFGAGVAGRTTREKVQSGKSFEEVREARDAALKKFTADLIRVGSGKLTPQAEKYIARFKNPDSGSLTPEGAPAARRMSFRDAKKAGLIVSNLPPGVLDSLRKASERKGKGN